MDSPFILSAKKAQGWIPPSEIQLVEEDGCMFELRRASFGSVYIAKWKGSEYAVKIIQASLVERSAFIAHIQHLVNFGSAAPHQNVQRVYGFTARESRIEDNVYEVVTELLYSVPSLVTDKAAKLTAASVTERCKWLHDAAEGMAHLHAHGMVLDMRPENVLLDSAALSSTAKVCPLNLPSVLQKQFHARIDCVYTPKEYRSSGLPTLVSNVYSFGVAAWELLSGRLPHATGPPKLSFADLKSSIYRGASLPPDEILRKVRALLRACWTIPTELSAASLECMLLEVLQSSISEEDGKSVMMDVEASLVPLGSRGHPQRSLYAGERGNPLVTFMPVDTSSIQRCTPSISGVSRLDIRHIVLAGPASIRGMEGPLVGLELPSGKFTSPVLIRNTRYDLIAAFDLDQEKQVTECFVAGAHLDTLANVKLDWIQAVPARIHRSSSGLVVHVPFAPTEACRHTDKGVSLPKMCNPEYFVLMVVAKGAAESLVCHVAIHTSGVIFRAGKRTSLSAREYAGPPWGDVLENPRITASIVDVSVRALQQTMCGASAWSVHPPISISMGHRSFGSASTTPLPCVEASDTASRAYKSTTESVEWKPRSKGLPSSASLYASAEPAVAPCNPELEAEIYTALEFSDWSRMPNPDFTSVLMNPECIGFAPQARKSVLLPLTMPSRPTRPTATEGRTATIPFPDFLPPAS